MARSSFFTWWTSEIDHLRTSISAFNSGGALRRDDFGAQRSGGEEIS